MPTINPPSAEPGFLEQAFTLGFEAAINKLTDKAEDFGAALVATTNKLTNFSVGTQAITRQLSGVSEAALFSSSMEGLISEKQRKFADDMVVQTNELAAHQIEMADGQVVSAGLIYNNLDELNKEFISVMKSDAGLFTKGQESMTADMMVNLNQAKNAFDLSTTTITEITRRELSKTGKITGEMLLDFQATIITTQKVTGESLQKISSDMQLMYSDFSKFGMMTNAQMGSMSAYVGQIGLSMGDVGSMMGKFQSFDQATAAMSSLAAATGVTLDTMELFKLANTDPEGFARSLKQQLLDQGLVYEEMNFMQKKLTAQAIGLSPQDLEAFLNGQLSATESALGSITQATDSLGSEEIKKATDKLVDYTDATDRLMRKSKEVKDNVAVMSAVTLESGRAANIAARQFFAFSNVLADRTSFDSHIKMAAELISFDENLTKAMGGLDRAVNNNRKQEADAATKDASDGAKVTTDNLNKTADQLEAITKAQQAATDAIRIRAHESFNASGTGISSILDRLKIESNAAGETAEDFAKRAAAAKINISEASLISSYTNNTANVLLENEYVARTMEGVSPEAAKIQPKAPAAAPAPVPNPPAIVDKKADTPQGSTASISAQSGAPLQPQLQPINIILTFAGDLGALTTAIISKIAIGPDGQAVNIVTAPA